MPQPPPEIVYDEGETSHQFNILETEHVNAPAYVTYQRGHRALFAATRRVLSPHGVEGVLPSSSVQVQVQDRGKRSIYEEGHSGGHDANDALDDVDRSSPSPKLKEIIQEQKTEIDSLNEKLLKAEFLIKYLEQRNK